MSNRKLYQIIVCGALISSMSIFGVVSAVNNNISSSLTKDTVIKANADNHKQYLKDAVIKLVEEGKLPREKAERILELKQKKEEELKKMTKAQKKLLKKSLNKGSLLKELIKEGIITEAEAEIIRAKLYEMKESRLVDGMQELIDKGVLTEKDIENIRNYMVKDRENRKEEMDKIKSMTQEERSKYFKEYKKQRKDIIDRMIEDKIITEKQGEEIKKAIPELKKPIKR